MASFDRRREPRSSSSAGRAALVSLAERRATAGAVLGTGSLACPRCDAPVAIGPAPSPLEAELCCPFCQFEAPLRSFLSLASPTRPTRVVLRLTT
jgi:hypothetical protein